MSKSALLRGESRRRWLRGRPWALALLGLLSVGAVAPAQEPWVIHAAKVWSGTALLTNQSIRIEGGKITALGPRGTVSVPARARELTLSEGWVLPGLVSAESGEWDEVDTAPVPEAVTLGTLAKDVHDPFALYPWARGSGVTHAYLSPGTRRFLPGFGSCVRIGAEPMDATVSAQSALHLSLGFEAYGAPDLVEPPVPPGPDNPHPLPRPQEPRTRASALAALRQLLTEARSWMDGKGSGVSGFSGNPSLEPFRQVLEGTRALRVRAYREADIGALVELARRFRFQLVIEGATEAWRLASELGEVGAQVVLASGLPVGGRFPADPAGGFGDPRGEAHPDAAAILSRAGVAVALVPPTGGRTADLLWYAAHAQSDDFSREHVLRAVTSAAAEICDVPDRAGTLAVGRLADVCVFDRDPLTHAEARPVVVLSAGRTIHDALQGSRPVYVRARVLHTATGDPIENGAVLVEGGKIVAVGKDIPAPPGARFVDADTVIPGLIDAGGRVGLRAVRAGDEAVGPAEGAASEPLSRRLSDGFDVTQPDVTPVARSGVTTLVLTPGKGDAVAGVLSAVKTHGKDAVVRGAAGVLFDLSVGNDAAANLKKVRGQLSAGQKYAASWREYEKKLKAFEEEQAKAKPTEPDAPRPTLPETTPLGSPESITGTWLGHPVGVGSDVRLDLSEKDGRVKGRMTGWPSGTVEIDAALEDGRFEWQVGEAKWEARRLGRDRLRLQQVGGTRGVLLRRMSRHVPPPAPSEDKEPAGEKPEAQKVGEAAKDKGAKEEAKKEETKKPETKKPEKPTPPKTDPALEPIRSILAADIPVFVMMRDADTARDAIKMLRDEFELTTVAMDADLLPELLDALAAASCGYSPDGSGVVMAKGKPVPTIAAAVRKKVPVALRSGIAGDSRTLYSAASHAVRWGTPPEDALKAVTRWSALIYGLSDRVGSIEVGKDADLVLLSGPVFHPASRIDGVMIGGEFVGEKEASR